MTIQVSRINGKLKMRTHNWFDIESMETRYGIQQNNDYAVWTHAIAKDGNLLLFNTKEEAKAAIKAYQKAA